MSRGQRILAGTGVGLALAALWVVPSIHALRLLSYALDTWVDVRSNETVEDVRYALMLAASYALCVLCGLIFAVLVAVRPRRWLILPGLVLAYAPIEVILLNPEHVITLYPLMNPWHPLLLGLVALLPALAVSFAFRRRWRVVSLPNKESGTARRTVSEQND